MSYCSTMRVIRLQSFIMLLAVCASHLSAQSSVTVSVGSSAVLHCDCKPIANSQLSEQSPYIRWRITSQTVFERRGAEYIHGEGYEDRVDVPEDELKKGNCSLIIKNIRPEDAGVYESYLIVKQSKTRSIQTEWKLIQRVDLSVNDKQDTPKTSSPLSAQSLVTVSVGSSAVLHCDCKHIASNQLSDQSPYIKWRTTNEIVFERLGEEHFQGEGYEDRVDVPEDKLKKGNCSLVLKEVKAEDAGVYESYLQVKKRSKRSIQTDWKFIQRVELSVIDSPAPPQQNNNKYQSDKQDTPKTSSSAGLISVPSQILMFTILTNILLRNT